MNTYTTGAPDACVDCGYLMASKHNKQVKTRYLCMRFGGTCDAAVEGCDYVPALIEVNARFAAIKKANDDAKKAAAEKAAAEKAEAEAEAAAE